MLHDKITKLIRHQKFAAHRIRAIAADCGVKLEPDFKLNHLAQLSTDLIAKIVLKLMSKKCTKLVREEEEMEVLMIPALKLFLAMRPAKIDLTAFLTFCPMRIKCRYFKEAVIRISKVNPDVEELSLATLANRFHLTIDKVADAELLEVLGKLTHLKSLRIEEIFEFRLVDVIDLCQKLPHLEFLKIVLEEQTTELDLEQLKIAEKMKIAMSKLNVFLFDTRGGNTSLINLCAEHLPNLRVIGDFSDGFSTFDDCNTMTDIAYAPGTSDLRHLLLDFYSIDCCDEIQLAKFPLARHLMMSMWPDDGVEDHYLESWLLQLSNLESLQIEFGVPPDVVRRFLEKFGPSLTALYIIYCIDGPNETNFSFSDIFALCPKLERLYLGGKILDDAAPLTSFSQLKEIGLEFFRSFNNNRMKLSEILRAPLLEKITLFGYCLDLEELKKTTALVADKKILRGLKTLHVRDNAGSFRGLNVEYFQAISSFIKCAVASIPGLKDVKFDVNGLSSGYSVLARSMRDGKTQNNDVPGVTEFFTGENVDDELLNLYVDEELIQVLDKFL